MIALPLTGGCQCGAVRYEVTAEPLTIYACHCTECQRLSSSAFGMSMPVPRESVRITRGMPKRWIRTADSGQVVSGVFCGDCGTRLIHETTGNQAVIVVKPGTLDDTSWLRPVGHYWTRSAQPWIRDRLEGPVFEGQARDFTVLIEAWHKHRETDA